ncbi:hypothetical protein BDV96DRAFT_594696 [Lophiotrema nucula]|uniref:DUF7025 domain-containing protein n=1 Tax=Lophiotrema nucula TaxID=690887 RepID=A0A6A5ZRL0_9PLEO|nr:hypothetical protein BDV96DRAFT_594696 [Lophiotrema nucula]
MVFKSTPLPFPPLNHNWNRLQQLSIESGEDPNDQLGRTDLGLLLNEAFVARGYTYARPFATGFGGQHVREGDVPGEDEGSNGWFQLYCWYYGYDGEYFRHVPLRHTIPEYPGKKKITALPCFPMDYEEKKEMIQKILVARGRK